MRNHCAINHKLLALLAQSVFCNNSLKQFIHIVTTITKNDVYLYSSMNNNYNFISILSTVRMYLCTISQFSKRLFFFNPATVVTL